MSEEEAKTKWCPFAMTPVAAKATEKGIVAANRTDSNLKCLGGACAAWLPLGVGLEHDGTQTGLGRCGLIQGGRDHA